MCVLSLHGDHDDSTYALVFPIDVLQVEAFVALADVASEGVDTFPEAGTHGHAGCTLIHICINGRKYHTHTSYQSEATTNS